MLNTKPLYEKGIVLDRKMLTQSQFSQIQFAATLNNFSIFYNVIKAVNFVDDSTVQLSADGVKAVVEDAKSVQATVYITKECFSVYNITKPKRKLNANGEPEEEVEPVASFGLNLKVFTDCLSMFLGDEYDSSLKILHKGEGAPLIVILEQHGEDDLVTECSVRTMEAGEILDFDFEDEHVYSKVNIKGPEFFALLSDLDRNCDEIEIFLSPNSPHMKLCTYDEYQLESNVEITNCSDMLISFQSSEATTNRYKFSHFRLVLRTLALASKVALRTNKDGLLGLQVMIEYSEQANIFVEYFIMPLSGCDDLDVTE
ncbi:uncharacterized protein LOC129755735 [Uranotaenia lowii]|uniref:uncharacterized protein LOC129755735 n=1 Tax=Uranotaenia lowii TaxID=190385 RepID=UPI002479F02F|nr:uncharacterized protein LOC129755735 [Uranotaenia lowii]